MLSAHSLLLSGLFYTLSPLWRHRPVLHKVETSNETVYETVLKRRGTAVYLLILHNNIRLKVQQYHYL